MKTHNITQAAIENDADTLAQSYRAFELKIPGIMESIKATYVLAANRILAGQTLDEQAEDIKALTQALGGAVLEIK